jgi:hypothetical protein
MFYHLKKWWIVGLVLAGMMEWPAFAKADSGYTPTQYGGNFGLGLELGDPGAWGISGKVWIDRRNAFQGAVKIPGGSAILQLDYLWHDFSLIHIKGGSGEWPFYIGVGGDLSLDSPVNLGARVPIGMSYIFNKKNVPVDIYLQLVPTLWFYERGASLYLYPEVGAHFYF